MCVLMDMPQFGDVATFVIETVEQTARGKIWFSNYTIYCGVSLWEEQMLKNSFEAYLKVAYGILAGRQLAGQTCNSN